MCALSTPDGPTGIPLLAAFRRSGNLGVESLAGGSWRLFRKLIGISELQIVSQDRSTEAKKARGLCGQDPACGGWRKEVCTLGAGMVGIGRGKMVLCGILGV